MALKLFPTNPYYDDFDETKNYVRILYRPGHSVQARELNQMQTALQAQIDRHGRHIFSEGSPVLGGNMTLDNKLDYVKVESAFVPAGATQSTPTNEYIKEFIGTTITGQSTGLTALVVDAVEDGVDLSTTLYVKYTNSGSDKLTKTFSPQEELWSDTGGRKAKVLDSNSTPIGHGIRFSIDSGVFFVNGHFVYTEADSLIISRYTTTESTRVAYEIVENIVTIIEDPTLGDNARDYPNSAAPGAHRYQILLNLVTLPFSFEEDRNPEIIQLMVIQNGVVKQRAKTEYSELANNLAQRTYEESGNYALNPFLLNIRELYNNGTNNGLYTIPQLRSLYELSDAEYTDAQVIAFGNERLAVGLEKSVAYVNGYRIELEDIKYVSVLKARNLEHQAFFNGSSTTANLGNYVYVDIQQGLPDISNFNEISLQLSNTTEIGTARARSIDYTNVGSTYKLYLFDVKMYDPYVFGDVKIFNQSIADEVQFAATPNSFWGAKLYETSSNSLIFPLQFSAVKTLLGAGSTNDTYYTSKRSIPNQTVDVVAGKSIVEFDVVNEGDVLDYNPVDWIAVDSNGTICPIQSVDVETDDTTPGGSTNTATVTFVTAPATASVSIIYPIRKNARAKTKTLIRNHEQLVSPAPAETYRDWISLGQTDVIRIVSIEDLSITINNDADFLDITDRYELDNGQRDNYYGIGRIRLKHGALSPAGGSQLRVTLDYYQHGTVGDYFSVDSYPALVDGVSAYGDIPVFNSSKGVIQLRDALDFRPTIDRSGNGFTNTGDGASRIDCIKSGNVMKTDIYYYLNRLDKIYVDKYGNFGSIEGVPALAPDLPRDPQDSMILYELLIPAWTFSPDDVTSKMIDNKRYTMRDIGKLERRIKTLEYYTTLSLLEKDAANYELPTDFFKNGFLVDNFYGHNIGNSSHPDYSVSMDKSKGIVRPQFIEDEVRLIWNDDTSTNLQKTGPLLTLKYTTQSYIEQPYSSYAEYVNPYNIFSWTGDLKLSPESDNWKDTETRPEVIIDQEGIYDSFSQLADAAGVTGTVWNEWQTNWSGVVPGSTSTSSTSWRDASQRGMGGMGLAVVTNTATIGTTQTDSIRDGVRTEVVPDTVTTDLGDRIVEVNFIPFIRSRIVAFHAERMKPDTRLYAFFDNKDVSAYSTMTDQFYQFSEFTASNPAYHSSYTFSGETGWPELLGDRQELITNSKGEISGFFIVPNNSAMKFRTGQRIFRLTDSPTNVTSSTTTSSEAIYEASGLLQSKENVVLSTRVPRIDRTTLTDSRTTFERGVIASQTRVSGWYDPLAQTIMVDEPGGIFATSIDLYFADFDPDIPVTVHLVTTTAGIPTMNIIPFSKVTKTLTAADISENASVATNLQFEAPVHLQQGIEYAIVILSMSDKPKCYVSVMGDYDLTNQTYRISKQPYTGVFFKSQNASTWTPEQEKDLKFRLNRAVFASSGTAKFNNAEIADTVLRVDPIFTTAGSGVVRVYHKNHGLFVQSEVKLQGVQANKNALLNGIDPIHINYNPSVPRTITRVEKDYYEFNAPTGVVADATGRAGGDGITATCNKLMDVVQLSVQQLVMPNTDISWTGMVSNARSLPKATFDPYTLTSTFPLIANQNTYFTSPKCVPHSINSFNGTYGTEFTGVMLSNLDNISPVIDLDRVSIFTVANLIDHPTGIAATDRNYVENFADETTSIGASALSKYITRRVSLLEDANQIRVILDVNRPTGTDIELYVKAQASDDTDFDTLPWIPVLPDETMGFSDTYSSYKEVEYSIDTELNGVEFNSMAFKIVFKSINSSVVPSCKNLRAIAIYGSLPQ